MTCLAPTPQTRFQRVHRLLKSAEFRAVFDQRRTIHGRWLACHVRVPDCVSPHLVRLGLVVPKRQAPTAVARNRVKRVVREVFRLTKNQFPPVDLVIRLTNPLPAVAFKEQKRLLALEAADLFARARRRLT
jgi:ribonuclease P protein component